MKKLIVSFMFAAAIVICFSLVPYSAAPDASPSPSGSNQKTDQAKYRIVRSVIGSGGIVGAVSTTHRHSATAGEDVAGEASNPDYLLISGYWMPVMRPTAVQLEDIMTVPTAFALYPNYPNPFNPQTTIVYDLSEACTATLEIFNTVGQRIRLLSSNRQGPGHIVTVWDSRDNQGNAMSSGIYLYRLTAVSTEDNTTRGERLFQQTRSMLLLK